MDLSNLKPAKGSINKNSKRVGRGQGSGKGGTLWGAVVNSATKTLEGFVNFGS